MDNVTVIPRMLKGTVKVPPSKSVAHRAIIAAALSGEKCVLKNMVMNDDITATLGGMKQLGSKCTFYKTRNEVKIEPAAKKKSAEEIVVDCLESGSTLRFLMPIFLACGRKVKFIGKGRLMQRPQKPYLDMFDKKGIKYETGDDYIRLDGKLKSGVYEMRGDISSQFITGLLFALPLLDGESEIVITTPAESKSYIDITLKVLADFGIEIENRNYLRYIIKGGQKYKATDYEIEGDYSQAAFFLVAGALGCDVLCTGLSDKSLQGDREIIDIIERAGGIIEKTDEGIKAKMSASMKGITVDVRNIPDLVPIMAVLFAFCEGESRIVNAGRLRMKESDRLAAITRELRHLGADITEESDALKIVGCQSLECKNTSAWGDHRIAMATAIAACRCEGAEMTILGGTSAVKKSYPDFFEVYNSL